MIFRGGPALPSFGPDLDQVILKTEVRDIQFL